MANDQPKTDFDPDYTPENPVNQEAAADRGLRYDANRESYVDEDGCLIRDKYGQSF